MESHTYHIVVGGGRRIVLPAEVCRSLSLDVGDELVVRLEDGHATLRSVEQTVQRFRKLVAEHVPPKVNLVDELIAEREAQSSHE